MRPQLASHPLCDRFRCIPSGYELAVLRAGWRVGQRDASQVVMSMAGCFTSSALRRSSPSWRPPAYSWASLALENSPQRLWQTKEIVGSTTPSSRCLQEIFWRMSSLTEDRIVLLQRRASIFFLREWFFHSILTYSIDRFTGIGTFS